MSTKTTDTTKAAPAAEPPADEKPYQDAVGKTFKDKGAPTGNKYVVLDYMGSMAFRDGQKNPGLRVELQKPGRQGNCYFAPAKEFLDTHEPV